jgi:hypothetical protein
MKLYITIGNLLGSTNCDNPKTFYPEDGSSNILRKNYTDQNTRCHKTQASATKGYSVVYFILPWGNSPQPRQWAKGVLIVEDSRTHSDTCTLGRTTLEE